MYLIFNLFVCLYGKFSEFVFNIHKHYLSLFGTLCMSSDPSTATESGDHRGGSWARAVVDRWSALTSFPQYFFPIFALYYMDG